MVDLVERLRETLPGIAQVECRGDNLAILLAGYFEPGIEDEELDDSGTWKQGAIDAANRVLDAIHAHYTTAPTAISTLRARVAELEARATPPDELCEHCGSNGFWCDWDFSAGESPCHRAYLKTRATPQAGASEAEPVVPSMAKHRDGCEHSRSPIWLCDCPRPYLAALSNQGSSSNGQ